MYYAIYCTLVFVFCQKECLEVLCQKRYDLVANKTVSVLGKNAGCKISITKTRCPKAAGFCYSLGEHGLIHSVTGT
jgi:hypothetical protein